MGNSKGRYLALVILGIGIGVILIVLVTEARTWVGRSDSSTGGSPKVTLADGRVIECAPGTVARWLGAERRLEDAQAELSLAHDTIAGLEARLAELEAAAAGRKAWEETASPTAGSETTADVSTAGESPEDEKTRKLKALIASTDWDKMANAIEKWIKTQRDARKNGQPPKFDPGLLAELSRATVTMSEISELLGLENPWAAYENEFVMEKFMPAYLKAQGVDLTDPQRSLFLDWLKAQSSPSATVGEMDEMGRPLAFGGLLSVAQREIQFTDWIRNNLTPAQYSAYCSTVENDLFYGQEIQTRQFKASTETEAAQAVTQYWQQAYNADPGQSAQLSQIAGQFVQDYYATTYSYTRLYGNQMPRHVSLEMQMKLLQLQAAAEQQCRTLFPDVTGDALPTIITFE